MNPKAIITKICNAIDQIIESSDPYKGLFPSILHPQTGDMLMEKPTKIPDSGTATERISAPI